MITIFRLFEEQIQQDFWYHGSYSDFDSFKLKKGTYLDLNYINPIFFSSDYEFSKYYARYKNGIIYTVKLLTDKIFDPSKLPTDLDLYYYETGNVKNANLNHKNYDYDLALKLRKDIDSSSEFENTDTSNFYNGIVFGDYSSIEDTWFFDWLKKNDFDGCYVWETGTKNLFIFDPNKIEIVKKEKLDKTNENKHLLNSKFWDWFGNSKVVEGNEPMVVYHGTKETFDIFDEKKIGWGTGNYGHYGYGFYFSDDIREADGYGDKIMKCYIKIEKPFTGTDEEMLLLKRNGVKNIDDMVIQSIDFDSLYQEIKRVDPTLAILVDYIKLYGLSDAWDKFSDEKMGYKDYYNDISNIVDEFTLGKDTNEVPEYVFKELKDMGINLRNLKYNQGFKYDQSLHWITKLGEMSKYVTEIIKKLGYDGVIYGSEHVVFYPNYIKSIDNDGSWDKDDVNIYS